ncbi:MAG: MaoC family dehydratase [Thermoleophilia bacterium]|nr:MaoC family dehydratase [Thermoleophilia bacterium]
MEKLTIGESAESRKTISESDVYLFAGITGDFNPMHVDAEYARESRFGARVAHGPLTFALAAGLVGMQLPGVGTIAVTNTVHFRKPVYFGDTIATRGEVTGLDAERNRVTISLTWHNQHGELVAEGEAIVVPPPSAADWWSHH